MNGLLQGRESEERDRERERERERERGRERERERENKLHTCTFEGLARSITCEIEAGGCIGL